MLYRGVIVRLPETTNCIFPCKFTTPVGLGYANNAKVSGFTKTDSWPFRQSTLNGGRRGEGSRSMAACKAAKSEMPFLSWTMISPSIRADRHRSLRQTSTIGLYLSLQFSPLREKARTSNPAGTHGKGI
jgi:hypothetical protein